MKPQSLDTVHKQKGWVPFSTFSLTDKSPTSLSFSEHLMPYKGQDETVDIPWGVYGTSSFNAASFFASHYAANKKKVMVVLTLWYFIEDFGNINSKLPHTIAETGGFLHTARLGADLRAEIREQMMKLLREERGIAQVATYDKLSWGELLVREPKTVRRLFDLHKQVNVIVHPVKQLFDTKSEESILVGSLRIKRGRIKAIEARYFPDIEVRL